MARVECWRVVVQMPGVTARMARAAEAEGWDGLAVTDSQNIYGDPYVALALAARATERLRLATGVTGSRSGIAGSSNAWHKTLAFVMGACYGAAAAHMPRPIMRGWSQRPFQTATRPAGNALSMPRCSAPAGRSSARCAR